jgi:Protein of unknown function (DUF1552)
MFLTGKHLSRRTLLKGIGASVALPLLDAMAPAGRASAAAPNVRFVCIEMVHGSAGSSQIGIDKHLWAPARTGRDFDLTPGSLRPLQAYRDHLTIVSNTDVPSAEPFDVHEIGGDHSRSSAVFLTQAHPKRTQGADVEAGVSIDQLCAQRRGQGTPIPSLQLAIEDVDQSGGCGFGYSCVYTDSISWASPTRPLPMIRNPRLVFDRLFSVVDAPGEREARRTSRVEDRSILDWILRSSGELRTRVGAADRARIDDYLGQLREIERRLQRVEAFNASGAPRQLPGAPAGVPDSFSDHVKLMFDLQALAFASDITRVVAFKLGRDASNRVYPESGLNLPFHPASHHGGKESKILDFARLNAFHVSLMPYFLDALKNTPDAGTNLLENTLLLYGSPMGDSNLHNHRRVPLFLAGHAGGRLPGGLHLKAPNGTPLANVMLGVLHALGLEDLEEFGDSERRFDLRGASM